MYIVKLAEIILYKFCIIYSMIWSWLVLCSFQGDDDIMLEQNELACALYYTAHSRIHERIKYDLLLCVLNPVGSKCKQIASFQVYVSKESLYFF